MSQSCYSAFQSLLRTLCLQEFPCGFGTWRNPKDKYAEGQYAITTKDYGIHFEKMEVLQEFLNSGTWDVDTSWSPEASLLRNVAVTEPWKLTNKDGKKFIHQFFKKLRIISKEITEIDSNMLLLKNLETLTLSANLLEEIPSENLPQKLKVLELCTNRLHSVASLCRRPPPLLHLGLSHNLLYNTEEYKYFTDQYWRVLMSLDLSYNNLTHLVELVDRLSTLPSLKNLVLLGNPFSVIPSYRGYTIDTLRGLTIFDDVHISADEKHHFKGLAKKRDLIVEEANFEIVLDRVSGIPMPDELKEDEERDEFPITSTQYFIEYDMLGNEEHHEEDPLDTPITPIIMENDLPVQPMKSEEDGLNIVNHESEARDWEEEIEFGFRSTHTLRDVIAFRDFLNKGITFRIMSKKTLTWPASPSRQESENGKRKSPRQRKESPGKKAKQKEHSAKGGKDKGKKKQQHEPEVEMRSDPPIITLVGSQHIRLVSFLEGDHVIEKLCHCGGGPILTQQEIDDILHKAKAHQETEPSNDTISTSKKSAKPRVASGDKSKKGKPGSGAKKPGTAGRKPESGTKRKDGKKGEVEEVPLEQYLPPKPITLSVKLHLQHWTTAMDSLK